MSRFTLPARGLRSSLWLTAALFLLPRISGAQTPPRLFVSANVGTQSGSGDFTSASVLSINREDGDLTARYSVPSGSAVDIGGAVSVWRNLRLGVAFSRFQKGSLATVTANVPHPFFFARLRAIEGTEPVGRQETAVHIQAQWLLPVRPRLDVTVIAGPTYASVKQDLISDVTYTEAFPFDTAIFSGAPVQRRSKSGLGGHVGADIAFLLTRQVGVGALIRFSRTSVDLDAPLGGQVSVKAGGLFMGGGVRLRF